MYKRFGKGIYSVYMEYVMQEVNFCVKFRSGTHGLNEELGI